jgi:UDP-glucuronate 4-epimerase
MRILVTGGSGFIGQRVVERLLTRGHQAIVMARRPTHTPHEEKDGAIAAGGDVRVFSDVVKIVREHEVERIVHVAYTLTAEGEANPLQALQVNALGAGHIFEAARLGGVRRVVFCGSIAAYAPPELYGDRPVTEDEVLMKPTSIYGATKVLTEFMASRFESRYGTEIPTLRISAVYGTGRASRGVTAWTSQMVSGAINRQPVNIRLRPDQLSSFVYVDDAAEQLVRLVLADELSHRVYNSGGHTSTPTQFAAIIRRYYPGFQVEFDPGAPKWPYPHLVDGSRLEKEIDLKVKSPEEGLLDQINQERLLLGHSALEPIR